MLLDAETRRRGGAEKHAENIFSGLASELARLRRKVKTYERGDSGDRTASQRGSSVTLNGQVLGLKWYGCHRYATGAALIAGENRLEVQITTVLGNYMKSLTGNPVARTWTARQPLYPAGLRGPVRLLASV